MLVHEIKRKTKPLKYIKPGGLFKIELNGYIWIKGVCYPDYNLGQKFGEDKKYPCTSVEKGLFSWLTHDFEVYEVKSSELIVEF